MQKVLIALFATGAAALAPAPATGVAANRRAALQKVAGAVAGALALPQVASADGAVSTATVARSRGIYGGRIAALSGAVSKGDFAAVADEKNAFILFNSGAYQLKTPAAKAAKAVAQEGTADIFAAVDAKDAGKLKAASRGLHEERRHRPLARQGWSWGGQGRERRDWKNRTPKGTVYQR